MSEIKKDEEGTCEWIYFDPYYHHADLEIAKSCKNARQRKAAMDAKFDSFINDSPNGISEIYGHYDIVEDDDPEYDAHLRFMRSLESWSEDNHEVYYYYNIFTGVLKSVDVSLNIRKIVTDSY